MPPPSRKRGHKDVLTIDTKRDRKRRKKNRHNSSSSSGESYDNYDDTPPGNNHSEVDWDPICLSICCVRLEGIHLLKCGNLCRVVCWKTNIHYN